MNLRKLPPSMLLALGLACGDKDSESGETALDSCLSPPYMGTETDGGSCLSETTSFPPSTSTSTSSGSSSGADSTFGPCLAPEPPTGTGTGTGTDSGTDTGTDTDTDGTTGMMGDEPAPTRAAAVQRVLERNSLPADVAARLRGTASDPDE